jgi:non-specific serine/threonine protein kinase
MALEPGRTLLHFRIEKRLGRGGMGEVYRAIDTKLGRHVALKVLAPSIASRPDALARFREEARLASALNHPNIVTIYAVEQTEGHELIVMELVEGTTVLSRAKARPFDYPDLIELGIQAADALGAAHALGLLHRDVKSANIILTAQGQAKILDFGLAKRFEGLGQTGDPGDTSLTNAGMVMGTPAYMSPEQTRGETLDPRSDVFSLGIVLYEAATGHLPFRGPSTLAIMHAIATEDLIPVSRVRPELPEDLDLVLGRAMAKNPAERYASARQMADALRALRESASMSIAATALPRGGAPAPNNLPVQLTSFIGRRRERAEVRRLFLAARLVTVMGVGGCGKTRLAIQVATDMLPEHPDGTWITEFGALSDPALVPQAVAGSLGVREEADRPLVATLGEAIGPKAMLLVLDNCEHLAAAVATLAQGLLSACPNLRVLVTSQEGLGISGEILWRIPTLSVPDVRVTPPSGKEAASRFESVRLFVERAVASQPGFALTDSNAPTIAQICHRLDGIPLAIELAAVRVKVLPPEKILARLEDRFQLLTGGSRTALPRQQTLRAAVEWSYDLLAPQERTLLNRTGIFSGGCTLEAVEEVCGWNGVPKGDVLDLVTHLIDKSLVGPSEGVDGGMRYTLLETIRAYARERAAGTGEKDALAERHAAYYGGLAETAEPELQGRDQGRWLDRLEEEHENLRQAIQFRIERRDAEAALALVGALWRFWWVRGIWREGRNRFDAALALESPQGRTPVRSKALRGAAVLARGQGDYGAAKTFLEESLAIARANADRPGIAAALFEQGNIANDADELESARALYDECLVIRREIGDDRGISLALHNLAVVAEARRDYAEAERLYGEALALHRQLGNRAMEAHTLNGLGEVAISRGDIARARSSHEAALAVHRELGDKRGITFSLRELGFIEAAQGDVAGASAALSECVRLLEALGDRQGLAAAIEASAVVAMAAGWPERALTLQGAARSLREEIRSPLPDSEAERLEARLAPAREELGPEAASRALEQGKRLAPGDAIAQALETGSSGSALGSTGSQP